MNFPLQRFAPFLAMALACLASEGAARADFRVTNNSSRTMNVRSYNGTALQNFYIILPGNSINPAAFVTRIDVETPDGDATNWFATIAVPSGGQVNIVSFPGAFGGPAGYNLIAYNTAGVEVAESMPGGGVVNTSSRRLHYLATGDVQITDGQNSTLNVHAYACCQNMVSDLVNDSNVRGIINAGDLTQSCDYQQQYQWYLSAFSPFPASADYRHFVYDGQGNHDASAGAQEGQLIAELRNRKRNTVRYNTGPVGNPFYSWDWHDVHFAQCNIMPANDKTNPTDVEDPRNALDLLQADLQEAVGNTGRPVVIAHHYGFENFSIGNQGTCSCNAIGACGSCGCDGAWWNDSQRLAYWNVIKNYNVVLLINGHLHLTASDGCVEQFFVRPAGAQGGPNSIPSVVAGSARDGIHYTDIVMGPNNEIIVKHKDANQNVMQTFQYLVGGGVFVVPPPGLQGDGSPQYPWRSVIAASVAMGTISQPPLQSKVSITPGHYLETGRIQTRCRLECIGSGSASIGN